MINNKEKNDHILEAHTKKNVENNSVPVYIYTQNTYNYQSDIE